MFWRVVVLVYLFIVMTTVVMYYMALKLIVGTIAITNYSTYYLFVTIYVIFLNTIYIICRFFTNIFLKRLFPTLVVSPVSWIRLQMYEFTYP